MSRNLNDLLKWSIENTARSEDASTQATAPNPQNLDPAVLDALFGGPSDADLMKGAMQIITSPDESISHSNRMIAFDNFEQLIESLDNANNLSALSLWTPLVDLLEHEHPDFRRYAAWCLGTAVQNNAPSQERLLTAGGVPKLVKLAAGPEEEDDSVRRKAIYGLSSAVRNYQPAMDVAAEELAKRGHGTEDKIDATNMDAIDDIMKGLREKSSTTA